MRPVRPARLPCDPSRANKRREINNFQRKLAILNVSYNFFDRYAGPVTDALPCARQRIEECCFPQFGLPIRAMVAEFIEALPRYWQLQHGAEITKMPAAGFPSDRPKAQPVPLRTPFQGLSPYGSISAVAFFHLSRVNDFGAGAHL